MARKPSQSDSQAQRFIQAARELGTDESEEAFDRALKKIASAPPAPVHKAGKGKKRGKPSTSGKRRGAA